MKTFVRIAAAALALTVSNLALPSAALAAGSGKHATKHHTAAHAPKKAKAPKAPKAKAPKAPKRAKAKKAK